MTKNNDMNVPPHQNLPAGSLTLTGKNTEFTDAQYARGLAVIRQVLGILEKGSGGLAQDEVLQIVRLAELPEKLERLMLFQLGVSTGLRLAGLKVDVGLMEDLTKEDTIQVPRETDVDPDLRIYNMEADSVCVCCAHTLSVATIEATVNTVHAITPARWEVINVTFPDGRPNPFPCKDSPHDRLHYMLHIVNP